MSDNDHSDSKTISSSTIVDSNSTVSAEYYSCHGLELGFFRLATLNLTTSSSKMSTFLDISQFGKAYEADYQTYLSEKAKAELDYRNVDVSLVKTFDSLRQEAFKTFLSALRTAGFCYDADEEAWLAFEVRVAFIIIVCKANPTSRVVLRFGSLREGASTEECADYRSSVMVALEAYLATVKTACKLYLKANKPHMKTLRVAIQKFQGVYYSACEKVLAASLEVTAGAPKTDSTASS